MAINIFHQCLIKPQPFAGSVRFLTVLFTFCSWQPRVNWLRASGRNYRGGGGGGGGEEKHFLHYLSQHNTELQNVVGPTCR